MRYIVTRSGARISTEDRTPEGRGSGVPSLSDIAVNHCRTPMFSGATDLFYSVAHHCVAAAHLAATDTDRRAAYFTLMHELECVAFGDVPGPVKGHDQRLFERDLRTRYLTHAGTPLPACVWDRVEYYDKVEQAASITWLGLPETVHAELWAKVPIALQEAAVAVTRYVYDRFPPKEQLDPTSKLAYEFLRLHDVYKTQAGF